MKRSSIAPWSWVVLGGILLAPSPARSDYPIVEFDQANAPIARISSGPVARNWTWHCDDPSNHWPLTQRCQVYDVTDGAINSGNEVLLVDDHCGDAATDPTTVVYSYAVASPQSDRRYAYAARCTDSATPGSFTQILSYFFYYDTSPPTVTLQSTPADPLASDTATFGFTCSDNSQSFDLGSGAARCFLYCTLERAENNQQLSSGPCDDSQVSDSTTVAQHTFAALTSQRYRLRLRAQDEGGSQSTEVTYEWTVALPLDAGADGAATDAQIDSGASDDGGAGDDSGGAIDGGGPLDQGADGLAGDGAADSASDAIAVDAGPTTDGAVDAATTDGASSDAPAIRDGSATDGHPPTDASGLGDMGRPAPAGGGCGCRTASHPDGSALLLLGLLLLGRLGRRRRRRRR